MSSNDPTSASSPSSPSPGEGVPAYRVGPRINRESLERMQGAEQESQGATWRGWVLGLMAVAGISIALPYTDFVLIGTNLTFNAFPMLSVALLFGLTLLAQVTLALLKNTLGLTRHDLTLVFVMTMVMYSIPGIGFWTFWSTGMTAAEFHAKPENRWRELIAPHQTEGYFPTDPKDKDSAEPRPVEWFYTGLPRGESVPWSAWQGPYLRWMICFACLYGIWFALAGLLIRRWSEQERLPFPVAQVPEEMVGAFNRTDEKAFLRDKLAWIGIGLVFVVHGWNSMSGFYPSIPELPLKNMGLNGKYLTEAPWHYIGTLHCIIFPSIIGLTFLLSLEVAFSLWFFYWVLKIIYLFFKPVAGHAVVTAGFGQGAGALLMMALLSFWMARSELGRSLKVALGAADEERKEGDLHPRLLWIMLVLGIGGVLAWLHQFGVDMQWAVAILLIFIVVSVGLARLIAEAGVFAAQFYDFPAYILEYAATPVTMGASNVVKLRIWDRMVTADWFRIIPLPNMLNALHLAGGMGLRRRTAFGGMAVAIVMAFGLSFFSFLNTVYTNGGANSFNWFFSGYPEGEFRKTGQVANRVEAWEAKLAKADETKRVIPATEVPTEAKTDTHRLGWMGVGGTVMALFMVLRRFIFWWPHPAGYVMWMASFPHDMLWFSFFLGWLCKWAISKYGGMRVYNTARRFFIGMVVGECFAAVFWVIVSLIIHLVTGQKEFYDIRIS